MHIKPKALPAFSLIETAVILIIAVIAVVQSARAYHKYLDEQVAQVAAADMKNFSAAISRYLNDNYGTVLAQTTNAPNRVLVLDLESPEIKDIYLGAGTPTTNTMGQQYEVRVHQPDPNQNLLETFVLSHSTTSRLEQRQGFMATNLVGAGAIFINENNQMITSQGWDPSIDLEAEFAIEFRNYKGQLLNLLSLNDAGLKNSDFLYRKPMAGAEELNRMGTDLNMAGFKVAEAGEVSAEHVRLIPQAGLTAGSSCVSAGPGALSTSADGKLLFCPAGVGQWKEVTLK